MPTQNSNTSVQSGRRLVSSLLQGKVARRSLSRWLFPLGLTLLSLFLFSVFAVSSVYQVGAKQQDTSVVSEPKVTDQAVVSEDSHVPMRLRIPSIQVDANVITVELTSQGQMESPQDPAAVGWFRFGPQPGEMGSAVVTGHLNSEHGEAGVFVSLSALQTGDHVFIDDQNGNTQTFVVRASRLYNPGYADEVFGESDSAHLNLVTCDGVWDNDTQTYSKRLVVFTDKVE